MIKCNLSTLMGERRLKVADMSRITGLNRSTITALYYDRADRFEREAIDRICAALNCPIEKLIEYVPDDQSN